MFTLSLYHKPGKDAQVSSVLNLDTAPNPLILLQNLCKDQKTTVGLPRYWTFARWNGGVQRVKHNGTTAILLEYPKSVTYELTKAINRLGFRTYVLTFDNTIAAIFPLEQEASFTQHCRLVSVLCELLGINGVSSDTIKPTYLIKPTDDANVLEFPGEIIPSGFIRASYDMDAEFNRWTGSLPTGSPQNVAIAIDPSTNPTGFVINADKFVVTSNGKTIDVNDRMFASLEQATEQAISSVFKIKGQLADLRKQIEG